MSYILFHVPHSSLIIPKLYWNICTKDANYIDNINMELCDCLTDELLPRICHKLICKWSRLFCDVEKFKDDSKEIMSKNGMGVVYTKDYDGVAIARPTKSYKTKVIKCYYDKYHNKLNKVVTDKLKKYKKCIIIDFHSYSDTMVKKLFNAINNPDICIGVDSFYTDDKLTQLTIEHFRKYGYSVELNKPYSGTIIPNKYLHKKCDNLQSIMLEINKRCYLNSKDDYFKIKDCIADYYKMINMYYK